MPKINLLPPERVKVKPRRAPAERSYLWIAIILPLIAIVAIVFLYMNTNASLKDKEKALQDAKTELNDWRAKNAQLQQYKIRQQEIERLTNTVVSALQGRVYWARILNEIAIMCPTDIWLMSLSCAASGGSGTVDFQGFALQCPNRMRSGMFVYYPDYRPIAGWLERMIQIPQFQSIWLSSASPTRQGKTGGVTPEGQITGQWVISFASQALLNMQTATIGGGVTATTPTTPTTPTPSTGGGEVK